MIFLNYILIFSINLSFIILLISYILLDTFNAINTNHLTSKYAYYIYAMVFIQTNILTNYLNYL